MTASCFSPKTVEFLEDRDLGKQGDNKQFTEGSFCLSKFFLESIYVSVSGLEFLHVTHPTTSFLYSPVQNSARSQGREVGPWLEDHPLPP